MSRPEDLRGEALRQYEMWRRLGLSESAAMDEVGQAGLVERDGFDAVAASFRRMGLSESEARLAAIGRDGSEWQARESFGASPASSGNPSFAEAVRLEESAMVQESGAKFGEALQRAVDNGTRFAGLTEAQTRKKINERLTVAINEVSRDFLEAGKAGKR